MDTRSIEAQLADEYKYKKLPSELSFRMRQLYQYNIPLSLNFHGEYCPLYTKNGTKICSGYNRIVIGDYGAFIEFDPHDAASMNFIIKPGEEYRIYDPKYSKNIKYHWFTIDDGSDVKIYYQIKGVTYADYRPGKYYVSPHEVMKGDYMRKTLFTHIDMDGVTSEVMVRKVYPDIEVHRVDYGYDELLENRQIMAESDLIIFTDISMSKATAELLEATRKSGKKLLLLDHHQSAYDNLHDLGYDWIKIDTTKSGALLAYEYFSSISSALEGYRDLATYVSDYDLWIHNYDQSKLLQFLWSNDSNYFANRFIENPKVEFSESEWEVINQSLKNLNDSYNEAMENLTTHEDCEGLTFGLIKSIGLLSSLVGDRIMKEIPSIDYLVIMNKKGSLSFRSLRIEVRKIAEALGGGGHPLASGAAIPETGVVDVVKSVTNRQWSYFNLGVTE